MGRASLALVVVVTAACSFAADDHCSTPCGAGELCPSGTSCLADGFCHASSDSELCTALSGGPDAPAAAPDAAAPLATPDAPSPPDARRIDATPPDAACVPSTEDCRNGDDDDCDHLADCEDPDCSAVDPYCCTGTGLVHTIPDGCMDDGGSSGGGDSLQVYCCDNTARFCLSRESCPWRSGCGDTTDTCSRSGLSSDYMANAGCSQWRGVSSYRCAADRQIYFP